MPKMIFVKRGKKYSRSMFLKNFCLNTSKSVKKKKNAKYQKKERVKKFCFCEVKKKKKRQQECREEKCCLVWVLTLVCWDEPLHFYDFINL